MFLLPGCQKYDRSETHSRVLVLVDVSASMTARDDEPLCWPGAQRLPTRQDVIDLLCKEYESERAKDPANRTFVQHVLNCSPVVLLPLRRRRRQGAGVLRPGGPEVWDEGGKSTEWLNPDKSKLPVAKDDDPAKEKKDSDRRECERILHKKMRNGTDIAAPVLELVQKESAAQSLPSDGQAKKAGADEAVKELLEDARRTRIRRMHVITVGVGEYRQPVRVRLNPLRAARACARTTARSPSASRSSATARRSEVAHRQPVRNAQVQGPRGQGHPNCQCRGGRSMTRSRASSRAR